MPRAIRCTFERTGLRKIVRNRLREIYCASELEADGNPAPPEPEWSAEVLLQIWGSFGTLPNIRP